MGKTSENREKRKKRVRGKIVGTKKKPRLTVYRSNNHIYAQLIDDIESKTLAAFSSQNLKKKSKSKKTKSEIARAVGKKLATKAKKKKIKTAVFDRGAYKYHGRVKALAEGARKEGLSF